MTLAEGLESFHFTGKTIVSRGEWKMDVPVDFHLILEENADNEFVDFVSFYLAQLFTKDYVDKHDYEYEESLAELEDDDED